MPLKKRIYGFQGSQTLGGGLGQHKGNCAFALQGIGCSADNLSVAVSWPIAAVKPPRSFTGGIGNGDVVQRCLDAGRGAG